MYGILQTKKIPKDVPAIKMPAWLATLGKLRTPKQLRREMQASVSATVSFNTVLTYNLHYEISGFGCQSAAVPREDGNGYKFCRRFEWDVGFEPAFSFAPLHGAEEPVRIRYTPGFVGALSGHVPGDWAIAMNFSPGYDAGGSNVSAMPAAWIIREMLASGYCYEDVRDWLLDKKCIKQAYIILVSQYSACWIVLDPSRSMMLKEVHFPEVLCVGNEVEQDEYDPTDWIGIGDKPYHADEGEWILDQYQHIV